MENKTNPSSLTHAQVMDLYFMEHRAKLLDIAAFLDRLERSGRGPEKDDFRLAAFRKALAMLLDGQPQRAKRVLESFSDPTAEPLESAAGMKGAHGAYPG